MPTAAKKPATKRLAVVKSQVQRRGQQVSDSTQARLNEQKAIDLRLAGMTYREIGDALGVHHKTAEEYVDRVLSISGETVENREKVLALELQRLDRMQSRLWNRVLAGDHAADYLILKIQDRRARYLGLDAPQRTEVSGPGGGPIEVSMDARMALAAKLGIALEEGESK